MADRKKPQQFRSEQMVKDIITATGMTVSEVGLPGATIGQIADKAGVSPGSIYQYFSTKKDVLGDFVVDEFDGLRSQIKELLLKYQDLPMREFNRTVINLMIEFHLRRPKTTEQIYRHVADAEKLSEQMKMRRETISLVADIFRRRQSELLIEDPEKSAAVFIHAITGALTAPYVDPEFKYSITDLREELIAFANRYLLGS